MKESPSSELSPLLSSEVAKWRLPHALGRASDAECRRQRDMASSRLSRAPGAMKLCFLPSEGGEFLQWFVTDGQWCVGFMSDDDDDEDDDAMKVNVRRLDPHCEYVTRAEFTLTEDVMRRVKNVCGGMHHSICLRNSEHLAKYIYCGSWSSLQMNPDSHLRNFFEPHLKKVAHLVNVAPSDLEEEKEEKKRDEEVLYPELKSRPSWVCQFKSRSTTLARVTAEAWNVLFLGPSGAGKSHVINVMFNQRVADSGAAGDSVTTNCTVLQGSWRGRPINIIDTVGFSNSRSSPQEILEDIKSTVKNSIVLIDVVVVVCSERIAESHQKALKKCLKWLQYSAKRKARFVFLYNKGDILATPGDKERCLADMGRLLSVDVSFESKWRRPDDQFDSLPTARVSSFPPLAPYEEIREDRDLLMGQVLGLRRIPGCERIEVSKGACLIL